MNLVIEIGRLTKDCDIRHSNDSIVGRFTLAVDRRFKRDVDPDTDFISCVCFGRKAEFMEKFGKKGTKFVVTGEIRTGSYTNKEGKKVYTTDVWATDIEFAESKNRLSASSENINKSTEDADGFMNIPDGVEQEMQFN